LINLKIFGATFGIGGAIDPIAPPLATRLWPCGYKNRETRNCKNACTGYKALEQEN